MNNAKKYKQEGANPSASIFNEINSFLAPDKKDEGLVDIMTFCNDPNYLNLPKNGLNLYASQKIILKSFYMGSLGNENLKLDDEEWEWLRSKAKSGEEELDGVLYENNINDVINKLLKKERGEIDTFSQLQLVLGRRSGKCREENDLIATTEGSITFGELLNRLNNKEKIGICTYDQEKWKRSVTYDIKAEDNGIVDCYKITTKRGIQETSSHNHPYLVWRENWEKPRFIAMENLISGDRIAVANCTELFGKGGIGVNKAALLGHLQGDGGTTHNVGYSTSDPVMIEDIKRILDLEFPDYSINYKSKYDYSIIKKSRKKQQNGSEQNLVKNWLIEEKCFGKKAIEKSVPDCILKGSKEEVAAFLSRLFGCDGWAICQVSPKRKQLQTSIGYCSSSEKLMNGVRHLLQKFGIHSIVKQKIAKCNGKEFKTFVLDISRIDSKIIFKNEIGIFSKEERVNKVIEHSLFRDPNSEFDGLPIGIWNYIKKILQEKNISKHKMVGFNIGEFTNERLRMQYSPNKCKILSYGDNVNDTWLKNIAQSDIKWDEVEIIENVGKRRTIALEVAGTNVIGGDLISHNTLLSSVITAYEAYKLLAINCGDPHGYYGLPNGDEISIINVALSQEQAKILFNAIQARLRDSPFFRNKVASSSSDEIRLYTAKDIEKIKSNDSFLKVNGSIVLMCGHSNPDSLAGRSAILLLFDEIAFFDESGKVTGKYFYGRLKPSLSRFYEKNAGKIVQISSPNTRMGIFYETFEQSKSEDSILSFQLPTWHINDKVGYDLPDMKRDRLANPDLFATEYGGQWTTGGVHGYFFEKDLIDRSVRHDYSAHKKIDPKYNYFLHVDPAKKSNNYSAVLVAKERYNNHYGKKRIRCILAGAWVWKPVPGVGLNFHQIDKEVLSICRTFRPNLVTYDDYHSLHSLQFLRSHGVNTAQLSYNRNVKMKIYQNLKDLMTYEPNSELILYDDGGWSSLLIQELKHLKFKKTTRGFSLIPDKHSDVPTDDLADALAGACSSANDGVKMSLPQPITVRSALF